MKLSFSLLKKEASVEADVEGIVEKSLKHREKTGPIKTRYQIRQEEKRKNKELEQKQFIIYILLMLGIVAIILIIALIGNSLNW